MKITVNTPPPAPQPPATIDLIGLSQRDVAILVATLGMSYGSDSWRLYQSLVDGLREQGVDLSDVGDLSINTAARRPFAARYS